MAKWSGTLPVITPPAHRKWSGTQPVLPAVQHGQGWWGAHFLPPSADTGLGRDSATIVLDEAVRDAGVGIDQAQIAHVSELAFDTGLGLDRAQVKSKMIVRDTGLGFDLARVGLRPTDAGLGSDLCQQKPRYAAIDRAVGADMLTSLRPKTSIADTGLGADSAAGRFSTMTVVTAQWFAAGTYTFNIPVQCRYIDVIILGAGGGGASSGTFYTLKGYPGKAGLWATVTLERGVHIPWTAISITIKVGTGGARGSGGATGTAGSAGASTILTYTNLAGTTVTVTAIGGAGGIANLTGTSDNVGRSPGNKIYNGIQYTGGVEQTGNGATGNTPGGGGSGGAAFGGAGGVGAPGGGWVRAYQ